MSRKNFRLDRSEKLAELLRTNQVKPVYHGEHGVRTLKELGRSYLTITKDVTRSMNRIKALYRSWGIPCSGASVYGQSGSADARFERTISQNGPALRASAPSHSLHPMPSRITRNSHRLRA